MTIGTTGARLRRWLSRVAAALGSRRRDREFRDELEAHFLLATDANIRAGLAPVEARRQARLALGNATAAIDTLHEESGLPWLETLARDVRYGWRTLVRAPGFALSTILVLALGIGTSAAAATMLHAIAWLPLPVQDPEQVVKLALTFDGEFDRQVSGHLTAFSYPEFTAYRQATRALADVAAIRAETRMVDLGGRSTGMIAGLISSNYFTMLGVHPARGRLFSEVDARLPVAVLSDSAWRAHFAGDPAIVGRAIQLDRHAYEIVGVASPAFTGTGVDAPDLWVPIEVFTVAAGHPEWLTQENRSWVELMGRVAPGSSLEQTRAEARDVAAAFDLPYPARRTTVHVIRAARMSAGLSAQVGLAPGGRRGDVAKVAIGLTAGSMALLLVLLICASNAAGLLLARVIARHREIAVRLALGASRRHVIRQLLTESALIALAAGGLGLMLAIFALRGTAHLLPLSDLMTQVRPGAAVLAFTLLVSSATTLVFGLVPARTAATVDALPALKTDSAGISPGASSIRWRNALLSAQVGASIVLLVAAALLARGIWRAADRETGLRTAGVFTVEIEPASTGLDPARRLAFARLLAERLRATGGIHAIGFTGTPPFAGRGLTIAGATPDALRQVQFNQADRSYFEVLGIPVVAGRLFDARDGDGVAVVNQAFARAFWPDVPIPVGRAVHTRTERGPETVEVIGVVKTVQSVSVGEPDQPTLYRPLPADRIGRATMIVGGGPGLRDVLTAARTIDPDIAVRATSIADNIQRSTGPARIAAAAAGTVGLLALIIAAIGIHGIVAYAVARRTLEIGVHVALGARHADVVRLVLATTLGPVARGAIAGGIVAALGAQLFSSRLFGLSALDPLAFAIALAVLGAATAIACYVPVRRALAIGPMRALRYE